jgi:hypothetical protein
MELIYRGTRDGMTSSAFHNKCDNKGESITLIKNEKGNIFGGYSSISWTNPSNDIYYSAPESFLFTLSNIYNIEPTKFPSKNDQKEVFHYSKEGPHFGNGTDLGVEVDVLKDGGWSSFPYTYQDILGKGKSIFTGDYNNKNNYFKIFNISLNSKNISSQNIKKSIEKIISDRENYFDLDLSERFFKNQIFNFQEFIFKKEINNELIDYKIPENKNNILIYVLRNNRDNNKITNNLDYIIKNNESFFYFEKVYIIKCYKQNNNEDQINLTNNSNNLIEFLIFQDNKNSHKNIFINNTNIFDSEILNNYNYFLICNNEKKIIKINNNICNNEDFKLKLKHIFDENKNTKKNELEELNSILNKLMSKNLNYYTNFKITMECYYKFNDSLTILNLYKIKNLKLNGSLRSNHYNLICQFYFLLNYNDLNVNCHLILNF